MNALDAAKVLNLSGQITPAIVKKAYREACSKYHPDRNPAGAEMMVAVNLAYETLKDFEGTQEYETENFGDALIQALNLAKSLHGVTIEVCGNWVWLSGDTKPHKDVLRNSKETLPDNNGFNWASKKKEWFFRPADYSSLSRGSFSKDDIRARHGSTFVNNAPQKKIA